MFLNPCLCSLVWFISLLPDCTPYEIAHVINIQSDPSKLFRKEFSSMNLFLYGSVARLDTDTMQVVMVADSYDKINKSFS